MDRRRNIKEKVKTQQEEKDEVKKDAELRKRKNTLFIESNKIEILPFLRVGWLDQ